MVLFIFSLIGPLQESFYHKINAFSMLFSHYKYLVLCVKNVSCIWSCAWKMCQASGPVCTEKSHEKQNLTLVVILI